MLGGGSMINFGIYSDDYFYQRSGIEWDMRSVEKTYEWVEDSVVSVPERLNTWQNSTLYALLEAGLVPSNGFSVEHLLGTKVRGSTFDNSGRRHGAVELLNKGHPDNLRIVVHATVDRITFSCSKLLGLAADGVVYHDSLGRHHEIHIRRNGEVIICAGAIGSPQLLLINGVGHGSYQESQNITIVRQYPDVEQFMVDNPHSVLSLLVQFPLDDEHECLISPNDITVTPKVRFSYYSDSEDLVQCGNAVRTIQTTQAMELYKFSDPDGEKYFRYVGLPLPENLSNEESVKTFCL
nr:hypothetical protein [Tanacetum cinerariifolium]